MADIDYQVNVQVLRKGELVDAVAMQDEDYGWLMRRLGKWANESEAEKDL